MDGESPKLMVIRSQTMPNSSGPLHKFIQSLNSIDYFVCGFNNHQQLVETIDYLDNGLNLNVILFKQFALKEECFTNPAKWQLD